MLQRTLGVVLIAVGFVGLIGTAGASHQAGLAREPSAWTAA